MNYMTTAESAALLPYLPRDRSGAFLLSHNGRVERTARADIALFVATTPAGATLSHQQHVAHGHTRQAREHARNALVRASAVLARSTRAPAVTATTTPKPMPPALTPKQRAVVNRQSNVQICEAVGTMLGRELALRDRRLDALERRKPECAVRDPVRAARARAAAALQRARAVLA